MAKVTPELLAACLAEIQSGRMLIDECVAAHPAEAVELRLLLETALSITPLPPVAIDPAFRLRGRVALIEAISAEKEAVTKAPWQRFWKVIVGGWERPPQPIATRRRVPMPALVIAIFLALATALSGGATYASQAALPGDALYQVKIIVEGLQTSLATSDEARAQVNTGCADKRLEEAQKAIQVGRADAARIAAESYGSCVAQAEQHLTNAAASGSNVSDLAGRLSENLARQQAQLAVVEERAPEPAKSALAKAADKAEKGLATAASFARGAKSDDKRSEVSPTPVVTGTIAAGRPTEKPDRDRDDRPKDKTDPTITISSTVELTLTQTISDVKNLATDPNVPGKSYEGLLAKLDASQEALERGQSKVAINTLNAFLNELNAMRQSGHISGANYDLLYAKYSALVSALGGTPGGQKPPASPTSLVGQPGAKPEGTHRPDDDDRPTGSPTARPEKPNPSRGRPEGRPDDNQDHLAPGAAPTQASPTVTPGSGTRVPERGTPEGRSGNRPDDDARGSATPRPAPTQLAAPSSPVPSSPGPRPGKPQTERDHDSNGSSNRVSRTNEG